MSAAPTPSSRFKLAVSCRVRRLAERCPLHVGHGGDSDVVGLSLVDQINKGRGFLLTDFIVDEGLSGETCKYLLSQSTIILTCAAAPAAMAVVFVRL